MPSHRATPVHRRRGYHVLEYLCRARNLGVKSAVDGHLQLSSEEKHLLCSFNLEDHISTDHLHRPVAYSDCQFSPVLLAEFDFDHEVHF
jgi:hypothetical protein